MKVLSYNDWVRQGQALMDEINASAPDCFVCSSSRFVTCTECEGVGESDCDCCGSSQDCAECEGYGFVVCPECGGEYHEDLTVSAYRERVVADAYRFSDWTGKDPLSVLSEVVKAGAL